MAEQLENPAEEIRRLRRCINDLVSIFALPASWSGGGTSEISRTLLDVLLGMLDLDLAYLRLKDPSAEAPVEMAWVAQPQSLKIGPQELGRLLGQHLGDDPQQWPPLLRDRIGGEEFSIVPLRLGLQGEIGVIVVGAQRPDFPGQTERLLLSVVANQGAVWLLESRRLVEQKRVASELDRLVAQRTSELGAANAELKKEIAERKLVEQKLREEEGELKRSEARKTAILNSALDCIVTIDCEGCITEFNPAAEHTFGYRRDEVLGRNMADVIVPPSFREEHRRGFARYLASGEARVLGKRIEMTAVRSDGSEFPVELAITRIPFDGPPSFTGYLRDITERKQSEEKLRRSEAYLAEAQKLSLTGSFGWKVSSDEHFWSDETFRIFEYDASTPVTLEMILERVYPEDLPIVKRAVERASHDGKDWEIVHRLLMPNGTIKHVQVVAHAINGKPDGHEFIGAVMDITATRCAEDSLRRAEADLAHVSRVTTLGEFAASIAHEVNQPLTAVINNANACLGLLPDSDPNLEEVRSALGEIIEDADRATAVIAGIRRFAKKSQPDRVLLDLEDVVADVQALARYESRSRRAALRFELSEKLPPVLGDRIQLQQVLLNLVVNGMDAMNAIEESRRTLTLGGHSEIRDGKRMAVLAVQDAGIGIKPDKMDKLFEAFYTTKPQGMGMGLAISRSIVEAHGGRLWAEPNPDGGATFLFSLPAAEHVIL